MAVNKTGYHTSLRKFKIPWRPQEENVHGESCTINAEESMTRKLKIRINIAFVLSLLMHTIEVGPVYLSLFFPSLPQPTSL